MAGWWRRRAVHQRYMLREASALFVTAYALLLLAGLACLLRGEAAYSAWRALLASPVSIGLHMLALPFLVYHAVTWFQVMPKTLPPLPLPAPFVTAAGVVATLLLSLLVWAWLQ